MKQVIKSTVVQDSKGLSHKFDFIRESGGYTFSWNNIPVDWSFTIHGYHQAESHYNHICDSVEEVDHMVNWTMNEGA